MVQTLLDALRIDPVILLMNGALFLLTLAVLNAVFWKPMVRHLDQRKQGIASAYEAVDATRREMERLRLEYQGRVDAIEAEARTRIQQTVREAQAAREQVLVEARAESERIVREGMGAIAQEKAQTAATVEQELDEAALRALEWATGVSPGAEHRAVVVDYISRRVTRGS